ANRTFYTRNSTPFSLSDHTGELTNLFMLAGWEAPIPYCVPRPSNTHITCHNTCQQILSDGPCSWRNLHSEARQWRVCSGNLKYDYTELEPRMPYLFEHVENQGPWRGKEWGGKERGISSGCIEVERCVCVCVCVCVCCVMKTTI
ncbi:mCG144923, partial [Mus musculus]